MKNKYCYFRKKKEYYTHIYNSGPHDFDYDPSSLDKYINQR